MNSIHIEKFFRKGIKGEISVEKPERIDADTSAACYPDIFGIGSIISGKCCWGK